MGIDMGKILGDAAKGVADFIDKTGKDIAKAIDQNGDGVLDFSDIQVVSDRIQAAQAEARRKADLERLKPMFQGDLERAEFVLPKMIRVDDIDKAHAENPVCKDSVGFRTIVGDMSVITIFRDHSNDFGLNFYPELDNGVYYVDPSDRDHYISLDEYFNYMKKQRVIELQRIAQKLGAKHFRITYMERNKTISSNAIKANAKETGMGAKVGIDAEHAEKSTSMSAISIEADMRFPGHAPIRPELHYLKNEINIANLIEMRMDPLSPLQHQHFTIEMSNSSGIKTKDAVKIDAALKAMKIAGNTTVQAEVQNEARRILEYEIEF